MRTGLSTIQQTLTPEAAGVLNQSIGEAARRGHSQTTPLHVAATLLASTCGLLRQACVRSHPNSSHPLQCRALELCFSVALDRLPSYSGGSGAGGGGNGAVEQPPISNALMAALKRAQAHQRRGCPEQQQQPLLAVKVELEQLILSILDDPSVSRVMREASFSSIAVKATIQESLLAPTTPSLAVANTAAPTFSPSPSAASIADPRPIGNAGGGRGIEGLGLRPSLAAPGAPLLPANRSLYRNPRLQQQQQSLQRVNGAAGVHGSEQQKRDEAKRVLDILKRAKKRNPVLVSDSEPDAIVKDVLRRIQSGGEGPLRNVEVLSPEMQFISDQSQVPRKLQELGNSIDSRFKGREGGDVKGVVVDLGDLRWLVESPASGIGAPTGSVLISQQHKVVMEAGRAAVAEMAKLLARFTDGATGGRIWLIGTATCATYLRCQVYHPTMENDWDLQAVPIAAATPHSGMLPRFGGKGILSSSVESLSTQKDFLPPAAASAATSITLRRPLESTETARSSLCPACTVPYERELTKLVAAEYEKSSAESKPSSRLPLPPWLKLANLDGSTKLPPSQVQQPEELELKRSQSTEELLKRWTETCRRLHPGVNRQASALDKVVSPLLPASSWQGLNLLLRQSTAAANITVRLPPSPPRSPVRTELALGNSKPPHEMLPLDSHIRRLENSNGCTRDEMAGYNGDKKVVGNLDLNSFKRLFKGLSEKVKWQPEAASLVAATVIQCKSGGSKKRRDAGGRGDAWMLFMGPDKVGKKTMAMALAELVGGGAPVVVPLGNSQGEPVPGFRGKTALDRVVEAVRRNPFSVVVLDDTDRADTLVQGSLKRAMERGRLPDSHGREVSLGNVVVIMISQALPENAKDSLESLVQSEEKLSSVASSGVQLELVVGDKSRKRPTKEEGYGRFAEPRKRAAGATGLSLDLNLAMAGGDDDATDYSPNSSDLTVEHEQNECGGKLAIFSSLPKPSITELVGAVDEAIVFKPVDFGELRRKVSDSVTKRFRSVVGDGRSLWVDEEALDRMVGGVWFGATAAAAFEEWAERVLVPAFQQVQSQAAPADRSSVVRLRPDRDRPFPQGGAAAEAAAVHWLPTKVTVAVDTTL